MKRIATLLLFIASANVYAQKLETLTVEKIMRDPNWIGTSPDRLRWSYDSKKIYFTWNPEKATKSTLHETDLSGASPRLVSIEERKNLVPLGGNLYRKANLKVYEKNGDIFLLDIKNGKVSQLTNTVESESDPLFNGDGKKVTFVRKNNLFSIDLQTFQLVQLTNFVQSATAKKTSGDDRQEKWLRSQQQELFDIIKKRSTQKKADSIEQAALRPKKLKEIAFGDKSVEEVKASPDGRFITYKLTKQAAHEKLTIVPEFVTASGFTEDIQNRTKVGAEQAKAESYIFDTQKDTVYAISSKDLPGIKDVPPFIQDYPKLFDERKKANEDRQVAVSGPFWSEDSKNAVVVIGALDNKDRWIMKLDATTGKVSLLDRQHDEAWIGGPGIDGAGYEGNVGWVDNVHFYYQSEASGYSHIYIVDVNTGEKKQLTSGKWEVQTLQLSNDKKTFYFTANIDHPGITNFYKMPVTGGEPVKLTSMKGGNEVTLSPDEKWLAIRYSYTNKPWELYLQPNKPGAKAIQVTNSVSAEYLSYPWRDPEMVVFKNREGKDTYAHLYLPKNPDPAKPAVVFVHGAGYLQNITYSWSYYFREFMFNNLLADNGYTVIDVDYTASAGYGRDWRTGIYRHMGGRDLTDQVDAVKYLVDKYGINPKHVGLYGGSYGGFITLMALFTQSDVFASGAALRSVTDWAHYNHEYTSNILNEPFTDEKAYRQSSPMYFADGFKGRLLMAHGMIDQNVNYQDIVRLSQKLIELHKENWELASYPVEDHSFVEPSSWTDEYKRIFKLFEETLKK